ncbi:MAG: hypothetical protein U0790_24130 [Isosphaeraceae bacterium]
MPGRRSTPSRCRASRKIKVAFRNELAEIVKAGGKQAGQQIDNLCNRYEY